MILKCLTVTKRWRFDIPYRLCPSARSLLCCQIVLQDCCNAQPRYDPSEGVSELLSDVVMFKGALLPSNLLTEPSDREGYAFIFSFAFSCYTLPAKCMQAQQSTAAPVLCFHAVLVQVNPCRSVLSMFRNAAYLDAGQKNSLHRWLHPVGADVKFHIWQ